ncbi:MAG: methylated-DNA--[protein]-cysteine S-methyltransferase [Azospirillaceae bacterium]|nr:methylated-DNA--[protein]-cysteine S-methyltransferase [Azospirillaceae bacterium]
MTNAPGPTPPYPVIAAALQHLVTPDRGNRDPAAGAAVTPSEFNRILDQWAGITPEQFAHLAEDDQIKGLLAPGQRLFDAAADRSVIIDSLDPADARKRGAALRLHFGFHDTPFGRALIGLVDGGVCWWSFADSDDASGAAARAILAAEWSGATLVEDAAGTAPVAVTARRRAAGEDAPVRLLLRGTPFQREVWQALLRIPAGRAVRYRDVAAAIGHPTAFRAVGRAIGANPVSLIVPCHRVIQANGLIHNYRWGALRKRAILVWEAACQAGSGAAQPVAAGVAMPSTSRMP